MGKLVSAFKKILDSYWLVPGFVLSFVVGYKVFEMEFVPTRIDKALFFWGLVLFSVLTLLIIIINLFRKKWKQAVVHSIVLPVCAYILVFQFIVAVLDGMAAPDEFTKNLTLPEGIELAEPLSSLKASSDKVKEDLLYKGILKFIGDNKSISQVELKHGQYAKIDLSDSKNLETLFANKEQLLNGLAGNPEWYVFKNNQGVFAFRRFAKNDVYHTTLNGYFSQSDFLSYPPQSMGFQFRVLIGFQDETWSHHSRSADLLKLGEEVEVELDHDNQMYESHLMIKGEGFHIEFLEQSPLTERSLTLLAIDYLGSMVDDESWKIGVPSEEKPDLFLVNGFQGGIYDLQYWINPGEPGYTYLKAFEITKNTPLSADRMKWVTKERAGWSNNPSETFYGNSHFTIYEGNWGEYYGARVELWFQPLDGKPERLLMKKNYRVQGWMH